MNRTMTFTKTQTLAGYTLAPLDGMRSLALVAGFSLLIALSARVSISLMPLTPVPITGQTFAVLLAGALLGSRLGALTALAYLAEGAAGLPFFHAGNSGLNYLVTATTAGYLLSYPLAAFVTGWLAEQGWDKRFATAVAAMSLGSAIILLSGWAWMSRFMPATVALQKGVLPFLIGDAAKIALAAVALPSGWALLRRKQND